MDSLLGIDVAIVLLFTCVINSMIAHGPMTTPATLADESWKNFKKKERVPMELNHLMSVSGVWHRAWRIQVARMGSCPGEIDILQRNAQLSQANYVIALAEEAWKVAKG